MASRWRHTLALGLVLAAVAAVIAAFGTINDVDRPHFSLHPPGWELALHQRSSQCEHPHGPFRTAGNEILDSAGQRFVATGVTVYGLSMFGLSPLHPHAWNQDHQVGRDLAQIRASARNWCANTVRIQGSPDALFSGPARTHHINLAWVHALRREVNVATQEHLNVVLTAQTEREYRDGVDVGPPLPTHRTVRFWTYLGRLFAADPNMFFDIFNEPRAGGWHEWFYGAPVAGYIGMNQLVTDIRDAGINKLLWVEGPHQSSSLARVLEPAYRFTDPQGIVYDIHHPRGAHTVVQWQRDFGNVAARRPVVVGEWAQYAADAGECWSQATTDVPRFLAYIQHLHLGLIAWSLNRRGVLLRGGLHSAATTMTEGQYGCNGDAYDQGAGADLMRWFYRNNS